MNCSIIIILKIIINLYQNKFKQNKFLSVDNKTKYDLVGYKILNDTIIKINLFRGK